MQKIAISKFKATCLSVLEVVRKTGRPILVTKFGQPVAQVTAPPREHANSAWLGCMAGTAKIIGDIVAPVTKSQDWEALRK